MIYDSFISDLKTLIDGNKRAESRPLAVGKPSQVLYRCGAKAEQDITVTKRVIDKAMRPEIRDEDGRLVGKTGHGLSEDTIIRAIFELDSPAMIFRGRHEKTLLLVTGVLDQKDRNIVVVIEVDRQEAFTRVNSIRSVYGRDELSFFISNNLENGCLLAANRKKADELLRSIGKSYPEENTFISFT